MGSELADIDINIVGFELGFESVQEKLRTSQRTETHASVWIDLPSIFAPPGR